MIEACNGAILFCPLGPWGGSKRQISLYFKCKVIKKILIPTLWGFSQIRDKSIWNRIFILLLGHDQWVVHWCAGDPKICHGAPWTVRSSWFCNYINNVARWLLFCSLARVSVCVLVYKLNRMRIWSLSCVVASTAILQ